MIRLIYKASELFEHQDLIYQLEIQKFQINHFGLVVLTLSGFISI